MESENLQAHLYALEERLLHPNREVHRSALGTMIAADFKEFCSSGRISNRSQTMEAMVAASPRAATISHYYVTTLAPDVALATYHATTPTHVSHRSSLWVYRDNRWQLIFHQGTIAE